MFAVMRIYNDGRFEEWFFIVLHVLVFVWLNRGAIVAVFTWRYESFLFENDLGFHRWGSCS